MPHVELPQVEFKVVVLGDTNTGKTSLVVRFVSGHYQSHDIPREPTIGAFFVTKRMTCVQQNMTCKLLLWDTAGQEQYTKFASTYYQNAAAAIITYDISQPHTIQRLSFWLEELHRTITMTGERRIVLCVAACKSDVIHNHNNNNNTHNNNNNSSNDSPASNDTPTSTTQQQQQQQQQYQFALDEGKRLSEQYNAIFVSTSAKENMGISFLFEQLCSRVLQYQMEYETTTTMNTNPSISISSNNVNNNNNTATTANSSINTNTASSNGGIPMIPVTIVNTTGSGGSGHHHQHHHHHHHGSNSSQSPINKQQKHQQHSSTVATTTSAAAASTSQTSVSSSYYGVATNMKRPLSPTMSTVTHNNNNPTKITTLEESDSSHTLPTRDPIIISETTKQSHDINGDTIVMTSSNTGGEHHHSYANLPSQLLLRSTPSLSSINNNNHRNNTQQQFADEDRSYQSNTSSAAANQYHQSTCNPICGDTDTVTAFVCGTDKHSSYCNIM